MTTLAGDLRKQLEKAVIAARVASVRAAQAALTVLAVDTEATPTRIADDDRALRVLLREKMRQLGGFDALVQSVAYEQWHTMLFARFLAENGLLMHPEHGVAVTLADCDELAAEEGAADGWMLAARYAAAILPGIFRTDDPLLRVRYAAEGRGALETLLASLPASVFTADDSLGWVYQFWQTAQKAAVNASGRKIGGADISPVTQLFTEPYMVQFLLHNTLGAWWAARYPDSDLNATFAYLRVNEDGTPVAGNYPGWPTAVAALRVLDPCCGSGHFLVAAFGMLREMRMREDGLSAAEAGDAVLRDNLFGLELDPRCTQIAAFAVALAAWQSGSYRKLPVPQIACSGIPVGDRLGNWTHLAKGDFALESNLRTLYTLFQQAEDLGSLIDPRRIDEQTGQFWQTKFSDVLPHLTRLLERESITDDPSAAVFGEVAAGASQAATLLASQYHLVITNPPFLGQLRYDENLKRFISTRFILGKSNLAMAFLLRCRAFCYSHGVYALVTLNEWLSQKFGMGMRREFLDEQTWNGVIPLGKHAFRAISGERVDVTLVIMTNEQSPANHTIWGIDASTNKSVEDKAITLQTGEIVIASQLGQNQNPGIRIMLNKVASGKLLEQYVTYHNGISSGDYPRFGRCFWEIDDEYDGWTRQRSSMEATAPFGGMEHLFFWQNGQGEFVDFVKKRLGEKRIAAWIRGRDAWDKTGIAVRQVGLKVSIYLGKLYDDNVTVLIPRSNQLLPALWAFCSSSAFVHQVGQLNKKLNVRDGAYVKVVFDLDYWQKVADAQYPNGLPEPHSDDPTQWLFKGYPVGSTDPLQVAVARLLGYHWPEQGEDDLDRYADSDGIVCLPTVHGEAPAADRLRALLAAAYGDGWSESVQEQLLTDAGFGGKGLDAWLRDAKGFFAQHCTRFHQRPFIWHIWDGRKDGFHALVNSHMLDRQKLERLTYTYLGNWIVRQEVARGRGSGCRRPVRRRVAVARNWN